VNFAKEIKFIKAFIFNVFVLTFPAFVGLLVLLEVFVRLLLPVSDVPDTYFDLQLGNHYSPNQTGNYVKGAKEPIQAEYRINAAGWNSPYEYQEDNQQNELRIAVIGDSYVEAIQVDYDKSFAYLAEEKLNQEKQKNRYRFYTFGHSGANLTQYLNVLKRIVKYQPDIVVINIVHNDFEESLYGYGRVDNYTLKAKENGQFEEVLPKPAANLTLKRIARKSALIRYTFVNLELMEKLAFGKQYLTTDVRKYQANVDINARLLSDTKKLRDTLRYLLGEISGIAHKYDIDILLMIDGDRMAIYDGQDPKSSDIYKYNTILRDEADKLSISVLDLTDSFVQRWNVDNKEFNWLNDFHWNDYGHEVVADKLSKTIINIQ